MLCKILIIDDDDALIKMLQNYFEIKGYEVLSASNGADGLEKVSCSPDIILLDINMPLMDGLTFCQQVRDKISCPILFLTARVEERDRVNGLMSGGDDYILKPFSLKELEARITAHLKREERHKTKTAYHFKAGLMIDYSDKSVRIMGQAIELTKSEYAIIEFLSQNPGQVFDKERIYEAVFGFDGTGDSRVITELTRRIRKKISEHTAEEFIETVWGIGYRWKK